MNLAEPDAQLMAEKEPVTGVPAPNSIENRPYWLVVVVCVSL